MVGLGYAFDELLSADSAMSSTVITSRIKPYQWVRFKNHWSVWEGGQRGIHSMQALCTLFC